MYAPQGVKTNHNEFPIPDAQRAWVLGDPGQLSITNKPVPVPKKAEVLVRIDAVAICATDLEIIYHGPPASIQGGLPFNKGFTPGHEYMGTVVALGPGVDEYKIGTRVAVEIHAGCGQCKRCREGMYTSCHNYGLNYGDVDKGHRANGFTTDGGFCEYQVNNINTLVAIPDEMTDEEGDAGRHRRHRDVCADRAWRPGRRRKRLRHRPGPDRADGGGGSESARRPAGDPDRHARQPPGDRQTARRRSVINVRKTPDVVAEVKKLNGGKGVDYVVECSAATNARQRGGAHGQPRRQGCLAAFAHEAVPVDVGHIVRNNIYLYGIRGEGKSATHRAEAFMRRSASMRPRSTPTRSRWTTCRPRCDMPRTESRTRSRWW